MYKIMGAATPQRRENIRCKHINEDVQKGWFLNSTYSGLSVLPFKELAGILSAIHLFVEA